MLRTARSNGPADVSVPESLANSTDYAAPSPEEYALASREPPHVESLTEVAAEALRTGLGPRERIEEVPGDDEAMRGGDPDVDPLSNELSGEEVPGGSTPSPNQNDVDAIGRAYGIDMPSNAPLRSVEEILEKRDLRH